MQYHDIIHLRLSSSEILPGNTAVSETMFRDDSLLRHDHHRLWPNKYKLPTTFNLTPTKDPSDCTMTRPGQGRFLGTRNETQGASYGVIAIHLVQGEILNMYWFISSFFLCLASIHFMLCLIVYASSLNSVTNTILLTWSRERDHFTVVPSICVAV